jgi:hypothetical protein
MFGRQTKRRIWFVEYWTEAGKRTISFAHWSAAVEFAQKLPSDAAK